MLAPPINSIAFDDCSGSNAMFETLFREFFVLFMVSFFFTFAVTLPTTRLLFKIFSMVLLFVSIAIAALGESSSVNTYRKRFNRQ